MSRALRELSNREKDLKVKQKLLEDALKIAELSLDLKHNNWAAHKWIGIILGDLGEVKGTKALLEVSPQIKVNTQKGKYPWNCLAYGFIRGAKIIVKHFRLNPR